MQQKPYVSREVMRERIRSVLSACPSIRMRHMRIRDWGKVRDMIIPAAATPPEMKCRINMGLIKKVTHWSYDNLIDYLSVNPTRDEVQKTVALLEQGTEALAFSTGMAAITALMEIFSPGDHLIATDDLYGGTLRLWNTISHKNGISVDCVDTSNVETVKAAIRPETKAIYLETPSNPMMKVADIQAIAELAHAHGCILIVDNTFLSPYFQKPLTLGADIVVHSGTKYLEGHNDTLSGFLVVRDDALYQQLNNIYKTTGACLSAFDSWLLLRGIKTLAVRMEQHQKNALAIAHWLEQRPEVEKVYYIGLDSRPDKALIDRQCSGYGGMISFRLNSAEKAVKILESVKLIRFAESLGGVESLLTYPMKQTHADVPVEVREALGVDEKLLRMSVGIENIDDLLADLEQAFA